MSRSPFSYQPNLEHIPSGVRLNFHPGMHVPSERMHVPALQVPPRLTLGDGARVKSAWALGHGTLAPEVLETQERVISGPPSGLLWGPCQVGECWGTG